MMQGTVLLAVLLTAVLCVAQYDPGHYVTRDDKAACPITLGFDFPLGRPDNAGRRTYQATMRGYRVASKFMNIYKSPNRPTGGFHLGEDWNGRGGGNTDLGDPIYSIADGIVINIHYPPLPGQDGWGPVVRVLHKYRKTSGGIGYVVALYGHVQMLDSLRVGDHVKRGQLICRIGRGDGAVRYAHLHFELRTNVNLGIGWGYSYEVPGVAANRARAESLANAEGWIDPTAFIRAHGKLARPSDEEAAQDALELAQWSDAPRQPNNQAPPAAPAPPRFEAEQGPQTFPAQGPWHRAGGSSRDARIQFEAAHPGVDPCTPLTSMDDPSVRRVVVDNAEPGRVFELGVPFSYTGQQTSVMVWHLAACRNWNRPMFDTALAVVERGRR